MFPRLVSTQGPGVTVLADGCAQLAQDLSIPTSLSQLGIQVTYDDTLFGDNSVSGV